MSADNIDKYAEFRDADDEVAVNRFDKYEVAQRVARHPRRRSSLRHKGNVKVYSEIADGIEDREKRLTVQPDGEERARIRKNNDDFEIVSVNDHIDLEVGWRKTLASKAIDADDRVSIHHPGNEAVDEPVRIGALRSYNELGLDDDVSADLHDFVRTARDL